MNKDENILSDNEQNICGFLNSQNYMEELSLSTVDEKMNYINELLIETAEDYQQLKYKFENFLNDNPNPTIKDLENKMGCKGIVQYDNDSGTGYTPIEYGHIAGYINYNEFADKTISPTLENSAMIFPLEHSESSPTFYYYFDEPCDLLKIKDTLEKYKDNEIEM